MCQESFDTNITDEMGKENIDEEISRRCHDENIRNPIYGIGPELENLK